MFTHSTRICIYIKGIRSCSPAAHMLLKTSTNLIPKHQCSSWHSLVVIQHTKCAKGTCSCSAHTTLSLTALFLLQTHSFVVTRRSFQPHTTFANDITGYSSDIPTLPPTFAHFHTEHILLRTVVHFQTRSSIAKGVDSFPHTISILSCAFAHLHHTR